MVLGQLRLKVHTSGELVRSQIVSQVVLDVHIVLGHGVRPGEEFIAKCHVVVGPFAVLIQVSVQDVNEREFCGFAASDGIVHQGIGGKELVG